MIKPTTTERLRGLVKTWQRVEPNAELTALLTELLDRRTSLTDEDRQALALARQSCDESDFLNSYWRPRVLAVLDRLLERKP